MKSNPLKYPVLSTCLITGLSAISHADAVTPSAPPPPAEAPWKAETVVEGLKYPWGLTWLPDGRPLITAKAGTLHVVNEGKLEDIELQGLPEVFTGKQGALMDVVLHPADLEKDAIRIYMTVSTGTESKNRTTLVRGEWRDGKVQDIKTIFQVTPDKDEGQHFGSRLLWLPDGTLLMSVGDGGNPPQSVDGMLARDHAQNKGSHLGSILRLTDEGKPAADNPFAGEEGALPELWTIGNRNIQGLAGDPASGRVWANEHGPKGGDELNLISRGNNYGWPLHTFGKDYRTGEEIGSTEAPGTEMPMVAWTPAHAPSGLAFYTGDAFPEWRGSLFSGGLISKDIRRIVMDAEGKVTRQERLEIDGRVRDVRQGPDGHLYAITDEESGRLLRIVRP